MLTACEGGWGVGVEAFLTFPQKGILTKIQIMTNGN